MNHYAYIAWIPLLPLASFLVSGLWGRKYLKSISGYLGTLALLVSTLLALYTAYQYFLIDGKTEGAYHALTVSRFVWLPFSENLSIEMGILLDPISVMMIVIVCFISLMVHLFSLGYMKGEERFATYYAFLGLFSFSMLGLVLSTNLLQMYIFWEGVGVSSFLLIGFYYERPSAVAAARKAFIVTRFADLGFLIGILLLAFYSGTLDINTLLSRLGSAHSPAYLQITRDSFLGASALNWALILVFVGGAGKSAMFPLHIWLPDAMEGPTPVSALIHAATMVVAGVYLVARLFPVFSMSEQALTAVAYTGIVSAVIAAVIACTQTDIKRVLAFSTMSQIGYMMFSLGVARYGGEKGLGYSASMFHLFTHAFFKSLLFLGAGVIIHKVHSNEMKDMGGLRKSMPLTHISFLIACLAIAGIPVFAGFFSKEEILLAAFQSNKVIYGLAVFTSGLTAFYMFRLYFRIFWNKQAAGIPDQDHPGEGGLFMKTPLIILALCSVLAGFVPITAWISSDGVPLQSHPDPSFSVLPVAVALAGLLLAGLLYKTENDKPDRIGNALGGFYRAAYRKFYVDEVYLFITKKIIFNLIGRPAAWIDKNIVDGFMNGLASVTFRISVAIKGIQSGKIQRYALFFFAGLFGLAILFVYLWKQP